ncbi:unnamed protein product [Ceratitis capitata]|uniref:(Mediterranean fruit fly) hypothetical protein n=1 Tax=Ceratitis capitata TaxID=7213 RepID=A0A811VD30_CERCA|nr:unnamed protein product [Ceratitis capitata]
MRLQQRRAKSESNDSQPTAASFILHVIEGFPAIELALRRKTTIVGAFKEKNIEEDERRKRKKSLKNGMKTKDP